MTRGSQIVNPFWNFKVIKSCFVNLAVQSKVKFLESKYKGKFWNFTENEFVHKDCSKALRFFSKNKRNKYVYIDVTCFFKLNLVCDDLSCKHIVDVYILNFSTSFNMSWFCFLCLKCLVFPRYTFATLFWLKKLLSAWFSVLSGHLIAITLDQL